MPVAQYVTENSVGYCSFVGTCQEVNFWNRTGTHTVHFSVGMMKHKGFLNLEVSAAVLPSVYLGVPLTKEYIS